MSKNFNIDASLTIQKDLKVQGNLSVEGTTYVIDTKTLTTTPLATETWTQSKLDTKVDKTTAANTVYCTGTGGVPDNLKLTAQTTGNTIMYRDPNGRSKVNSPTSNYEIANKLYVDTTAAPKIENVNYSHRNSAQVSLIQNGRLTAKDDDTAAGGYLKWGQVEPMGFSARLHKQDGLWQQTTVCIDPNRVNEQGTDQDFIITAAQWSEIGEDAVEFEMNYPIELGTFELLGDNWKITDIGEDDQVDTSGNLHLYLYNNETNTWKYEVVAGDTVSGMVDTSFVLSLPGVYFTNDTVCVLKGRWLISYETKTYNNSIEGSASKTITLSEEEYNKIAYIAAWGTSGLVGRYSPKTVIGKECLEGDFQYQVINHAEDKVVDLVFDLEGFGVTTLDRIEIEFGSGNNGENYAYLPSVDGHLATEEWTSQKINKDITSMFKLDGTTLIITLPE